VVVKKLHGGKGSMTHLVYHGEFSADFHVLSLCLQMFLIAFDCAVNDGEWWRGCRDTVEGPKDLSW
jgi:hypothetical protein